MQQLLIIYFLEHTSDGEPRSGVELAVAAQDHPRGATVKLYHLAESDGTLRQQNKEMATRLIKSPADVF